MERQAQRERKTEGAKQILNEIFEIANEAYIHEQKSDSNAIDPKNWKEWLDLFKEGYPVYANTSQEFLSHSLIDEEENSTALPDSVKGANEMLDFKELSDFLEGRGQWTPSIVSENKPNLEELLAGGTQAIDPKAKGAQVDKVVLEEGESEIPDDIPQNYLLGDAIETIIKINFPEEKEKTPPKVPNHLSLKVCVVGRAFSGKKTQSEKLKKEFGLNLYSMEDLVHEALEICD
jgi:hypothetical protein